MHPLPLGRRLLAAVLAGVAGTVLVLAAVVPVFAHQQVDFGPYHLEIGFIDEPVYVGDKSGLEFDVFNGDNPVEGLEKTLKAQVIYQGQSRDLDIEPETDDSDNFYRAYFIPTAAGPYTFHIYGTIEGMAFDQSYTSSPTGFDEVQDAAPGEFPVQLPTLAELQANAQKGADAASQVTIALILGGAGVVIGLFGVGLALAARRRPTS
ncbi:MAG TPA: hypothetical protein VMH24_03745 [Candidatus Sulfotelmatobacter sp.]|nr:hypothetical protein [Candidatus Sulfotelmatobacter sp.]